MIQVLAKKYPTWFGNRDFYISGESYAGKFVPIIADRILNENTKAWWTGNYVIHIKGITIGSGWTDPYHQIEYFSKYGYSVGILSDKEADRLSQIETEGMHHAFWHDWLKARDSFWSLV
jgi:carboxypeptidase C (cathepsin A)